jgi:serine protease
MRVPLGTSRSVISGKVFPFSPAIHRLRIPSSKKRTMNSMRLPKNCALISIMLFGFLGLASTAKPATIHVPGDQPTIQAGINAASNGDTVLVAPGTYVENINFNGKAITVTSSGGPTTTIIDGGQVASVVTIASGEGPSSVLSGFTIRNGTTTFNSQYEGGGVYIRGSSPEIIGNVIVDNTGCVGIGIGITSGSPLIEANTISHNAQTD